MYCISIREDAYLITVTLTFHTNAPEPYNAFQRLSGEDSLPIPP